MGCCGAATRVQSSKVNDRGVPTDLEHFEGPVRDRHCRDVVFLLLFSAFCGFLAYVLGSASMKGDPDMLIYGYDDYGNVCGKKNKYIPNATQSGQDKTQEPYLFTCLPPSLKCIYNKTCVKNCPEGYKPTAFRRCFSNQTLEILNGPVDITMSFFEKAGSDISLCYKEIIILCFFSVGLACAVMLVLRFFSAVIIWLILIVVSLGAIGATAYIWFRYYDIQRILDKLQSSDSEYETVKKEKMYWLIGGICAAIITVIFILLVIVMRKRIQLVAALFKEAGKAIAAVPFVLAQPLWTFLCLASISAGWGYGYLYIHTAWDPVVRENGSVYFRLNQFFTAMKWYHFMAFFWFTQFVIACQDVVIAGAIAVWFFTRDKTRLGTPILTSTANLIRYHLGSVALGSLLIALMKLIRAMFKCLERQLSRYSESCGVLLKCCRCCLWCFERFLIYLNRNAYIEIAIYGYSFCKGAQEAFRLLTANILRVAAINSVGDFILFMAKVGVIVATAFVGLELIKERNELSYRWVPILVACIFAFLVSHCFLSVYEIVIDTLFLCFCEDCERNDGLNRPYYMSKSLMAFVEKSKRAGLQKRNSGVKTGA